MKPSKLVQEAVEWVNKNDQLEPRDATLALAYVVAAVGDRLADTLDDIKRAVERHGN